ncbi:cytochrome C-type biogenesis protein CcmE [Bordetella bronchiseptica CA90 BB1334]|uniref:cytochrome c maturation protein CcmE n=1 Tax=Alcaligenaceae TaxID=506 RepID=UPI00046157DB|nr:MULTISPECIES: cytochrome c maturation protein CcmE [Alcaligenaceae]KDB77630.1 cytochrome C-type biogenesis protein CcmE [Bordetella bronchiseptica CA90 BB1334]KDD41797.1 cytochrome C-type biogenesis protein CcmE [Bordetella bronchiseptica OSU095]MCD0498056.1 cytochrome c maturation protein CcmE [Achromobacter sp. MY14]
MTKRTRRLGLVLGGLASLGAASALVLNAFQSNLVFFFTPTQVSNNEVPAGRTFRVGGMVEGGSVQRTPGALTVRFVVTDTAHRVPVAYDGILPDLFSEGKGVVAQGRLDGNGWFQAEEVLAKHDENYLPPEAQHAIDQAAPKSPPQEARPR